MKFNMSMGTIKETLRNIENELTLTTPETDWIGMAQTLQIVARELQKRAVVNKLPASTLGANQ